MTPDQVRQAIKAHEAAASRARSPEKRRQHEEAATHYRKEYGIPEPVSFGGSKDRARAVRSEIQKREQEFKNR